ncbi:hypothetical protein D3H35_11070 [Cohnella faecalis]|uniref:Uncharacterized protein n=1 Tax=Cohnella faecalis TaxID=2315694 RepID=A0A398CWI0_9BACL|nr:hypothetical protein D3H35_11070 [Cohnella faecalis]
MQHLSSPSALFVTLFTLIKITFIIMRVIWIVTLPSRFTRTVHKNKLFYWFCDTKAGSSAETTIIAKIVETAYDGSILKDGDDRHA